MASLYRRLRSPFWWVQFIDKHDDRKNRSTGLRADSPKDTAAARRMLGEIESGEILRGRGPGAGGQVDSARGWSWVDPWLRSRSCDELTRTNYVQQWEWISLFLSARKISGPDDVRYSNARELLEWRKNYRKRTGKSVSHNTALQNVKLFSLIMAEAVRMELCKANPIVKTGLKREDAAEKPEITSDEFAVILPALEAEPEWMLTSFLIAMHTGCRLRETVIPMDCIDFERRIIFFPTPKGGKKRAFSVPMPLPLLPLFERLIKARRTVTCELPFQPSRQWQHFFRRFGLSHLCFHCTRVTFITSLARREVPLSAAMRMVNHSSMLIHRVYQRLAVDDLRAWATGLSLPAAATPRSLREKHAHPATENRRSLKSAKPNGKKR